MLRMVVLHHHYEHAGHRGREPKRHNDVGTEHMSSVGAATSVVASSLWEHGTPCGTNRMVGASATCGGTYAGESDANKISSHVCSYRGIHTQTTYCAGGQTHGAANSRGLTDGTEHSSELDETHGV